MDLRPYVDRLRTDLAAAADAAGPQVQEAAQRLGYALDPFARLALMDAVVQAAAEITAELPAGRVDVRLGPHGLDFVVDLGPAPDTTGPADPAPSTPDEDDAAVARLTLRLPESVKARAEELAARSGHSLNTWVVNALRTATREPQGAAVRVDLDLSSQVFGSGRSAPHRITGWQ